MKIQKYKITDVFVFLVSLLGVISFSSVKKVSAEYVPDGGIHNATTKYDIADAHWQKVGDNIRSGGQLFPIATYYDNWNTATVDVFFDRMKNADSKAREKDFLSARDRWVPWVRMISGQSGISPINTWSGGIRSVLGNFPNDDGRTNEIYNEMFRKIPGFNEAGTFVYGSFTNRECSQQDNKTCTCKVGNRKPTRVENRNYQTNREFIDIDYSYRVVATPVKPKGYDSLTDEQKQAWLETHQTQSTAPSLTAAGQYLTSFDKNTIQGAYDSKEKWDDLMKKFNDLNNQNTTSGQIQFTANNQKGIANGAVYTVTTYVKKVRLQASVTDHTQVDTVCEKTSDFHSKWVEHTKVLKELYSDLNTNDVDVMADTGYYPKTSFQILSVFCNKEGAKTITNTIISKAKDSNGIEQGTKYYIVNRNSGLVADVDNFNTRNEANLIQQTKNTNIKTNQQWIPVPLGDGYYKFKSVNSGNVIDVYAMKSDNNTNIQMYEDKNSSNQIWKLVSVGNGYFKFLAKHCNKAMEVGGGRKNALANINLYEDNGTPAQNWKLERADDTPAAKIIYSSSSDGTTMVETRAKMFTVDTTFNNLIDTDFMYKQNDCSYKCAPKAHYVEKHKDDHGKFGAQVYDGSQNTDSSDTATFFRDFQAHSVTVPQFAPVLPEGSRDYYTRYDDPQLDGRDTSHVTAVLDKKGTPYGDLFKFAVSPNNRNNNFVSDFPNVNYNVGSNAIDHSIYFAGGYASVANRPHRVNVYDSYLVNKPSYSIRILNNDGVIQSPSGAATNVSVTCPIAFNTLEPTEGIVQKGPEDDPFTPITTFTNKVNRFFTVKFVKNADKD